MSSLASILVGRGFLQALYTGNMVRLRLPLTYIATDIL